MDTRDGTHGTQGTQGMGWDGHVQEFAATCRFTLGVRLTAASHPPPGRTRLPHPHHSTPHPHTTHPKHEPPPHCSPHLPPSHALSPPTNCRIPPPHPISLLRSTHTLAHSPSSTLPAPHCPPRAPPCPPAPASPPPACGGSAPSTAHSADRRRRRTCMAIVRHADTKHRTQAVETTSIPVAP